MKAMLGNDPLNSILTMKLRPGSCALFRYGPGSSGDIVLKQLFSDTREDTYSVYISTHETREEVRSTMRSCDVAREPEIISLVPFIVEGLAAVKRKDKFRVEGVMVTDLLEMTGRSRESKGRLDLEQRMLAELSAVSSKQVLPFRLVLDSISDLAEHTSLKELKQRIHILKEALRDKGGIALLGAPLDWDGLDGGALTLFDAIIEVKAVRSEDTWKRYMTFLSIKNAPERPEEFELTYSQSIPIALAV